MTNAKKLCGSLVPALVLAILLVAGCKQNATNPDANLPFGPTGTLTTTVNGFAWDPEAFWFTTAACGPMCPFPPARIPGLPIFERSLVVGAQIQLFDPMAGQLAYRAPMLSRTDGSWGIAGVTMRPGPPFFSFTTVPASPSDGGTPLADDGGVPMPDAGLPPVPSARYLPTLSLKPIVTGNSTVCYAQPASLISDSGILEAVVSYLVATGSTTIGTAADLLDPAKCGGVAVWWLYRPGSGALRAPATNTRMIASSGQALLLGWAPPGSPVPLQSPRGFYVAQGAPVSPIGLTVVVLPPSAGPPTPLMFTPEDPSMPDPATLRPYSFPALPPTPIAPRMISFGEVPAIAPAGILTPSWACLPPPRP